MTILSNLFSMDSQYIVKINSLSTRFQKISNIFKKIGSSEKHT